MNRLFIPLLAGFILIITLHADLHAIPLDGPAEDKNITDQYDDVWMDIDNLFDEVVIEKLKEYRILFVPGFLSDVVIRLRKFDPLRTIKLGAYFGEQMAWLKALEIPYKRVPINSQASPEVNAKIIREDVLLAKQQGFPVIVIAHSKGGIDTLEALISDANIQEFVKGFIPIQSSIWGSPIADGKWASSLEPALRKVANQLIKAMGGTKASLECLTSEYRINYFKEHENEILAAMHTIPVISFGSAKKNQYPILWDTILEWPRNWIDKHHGPNDGVVVATDAIYPEADYVLKEGMDHIDTVSLTPFHKFDRVRFLKTLLYMTLKKIEN